MDVKTVNRKDNILMFDVTGIGDLQISLIEQGKAASGLPYLLAYPAGETTVFLTALARFGLNTRAIGKVGKDSFGKLIIDVLSDVGVDTKCIAIDDDFTTTISVKSTADENPLFYIKATATAGSSLKLSELPQDLENTKIMYFSANSLSKEPSRSTTIEAVYRARADGALIAFDANCNEEFFKNERAAKEDIKKAVSISDIVRISETKLLHYYGQEPKEGADTILQQGATLCFVTLSERGCLFCHKNYMADTVPNLSKLEPLDKSGAGDIFFAGAIFSLVILDTALDTITLQQLESVSIFANASAYLSTQKKGSISSIPEVMEVKSYITKHLGIK